MIKPTIGKPKGILNFKAGEKKFQLSRHLPAQDLGFFLDILIKRTSSRTSKPSLEELRWNMQGVWLTGDTAEAL